MNKISCIIVGSLLLTTAPAAYAQAPGRSAQQAQIVEKRKSVAGVHADAIAVLAALQRDPGLARRLAADPARGTALLRANGATRAEQLIVTTSPAGGAALSIIITIKIDKVVITIEIEL